MAISVCEGSRAARLFVLEGKQTFSPSAGPRFSRMQTAFLHALELGYSFCGLTPNFHMNSNYNYLREGEGVLPAIRNVSEIPQPRAKGLVRKEQLEKADFLRVFPWVTDRECDG